MSDRREALLKAWDSAEKDETEEGLTDPPVPKEEKDEKQEVKPDEKPEGETEQPKDEKKDPPKDDDADKKEREAAQREQREPPKEEPKDDKQVATDRAPQSWKPAVREHWNALPADVRAEINRRELQIQQELSKTAQIRRFSQDFANVIAPYSHLIRAQNSTPLRAINNLMTTAAGLMTGSADQKAAIVAEIISSYGVDIKVLDGVLSKAMEGGRVGGSGGPNYNEGPPPWAQPIFQFMDNLQGQQQAYQERQAQEAERQVQAMMEKPFFEDLREDMADLMDLATRRGRTMTMEQAYTIALNNNPEIKAIVDQRAKANGNGKTDVSRAASTLARARRASSTISGAPAGKSVGAKPAPKNRREALEQAWEDQESR